MIKLYDYPQCPFCRKVRIVLAEKDIKYERIFVDLRKKEQKQTDFLKLNPYGKVPVIEDDGVVIYESSVINEYLDERYPSPPLMPSDPAGKAKVRILVDFCESHLFPPWYNVYKEITFKGEHERNHDLVEKGKNEIKGYLYRLEKELKGKDYLVSSYSLADIAFTPRIALFESLGITTSPEFINVTKWIERIQSRPSYQSLEL
jgi:glutathione S-transferase